MQVLRFWEAPEEPYLAPAAQLQGSRLAASSSRCEFTWCLCQHSLEEFRPPPVTPWTRGVRLSDSFCLQQPSRPRALVHHLLRCQDLGWCKGFHEMTWKSASPLLARLEQPEAGSEEERRTAGAVETTRGAGSSEEVAKRFLDPAFYEFFRK